MAYLLLPFLAVFLFTILYMYFILSLYFLISLSDSMSGYHHAALWSWSRKCVLRNFLLLLKRNKNGKTEAKTAILKTSSQRNRLYLAPPQNLLSKILKYFNIFNQNKYHGLYWTCVKVDVIYFFLKKKYSKLYSKVKKMYDKVRQNEVYLR